MALFMDVIRYYTKEAGVSWIRAELKYNLLVESLKDKLRSKKN